MPNFSADHGQLLASNNLKTWNEFTRHLQRQGRPFTLSTASLDVKMFKERINLSEGRLYCSRNGLCIPMLNFLSR